MISNFKQHFRGVTTSIVAPPVLLLAKVSARRAKYKAKVQKLSLFISEPQPNLRVSESARRAKYKAKVQKLSLFISKPPPNLRVSESARRAKCELKRREKTTNRNRNTLHNAASLTQSQSLMGATRLASGHFSAASSRVGFFSSFVPREKCNVHTLNKGSQIAVITLLSVSLCLKIRCGTRLLKNAPTRDASPPLELAFSIRLQVKKRN